MTPEFEEFCQKRFRDAVAIELGAGFPYYFSNVPVSENIERYAVMHVLASEDALPINLGRKAKARNVGVIQIDVYTPKDTGNREGKEMAWKLAKHFRRLELPVDTEGSVTFRDPTVQDRGEVRNRHKEMVSAPYRYDFDPELLDS